LILTVQRYNFSTT